MIFCLLLCLSISFQYFLGLYKLRDTRHIAISGPSGCGKSTIIKKLVNSNPQYKFSVSHTSRPMRKGEVHGVDYFFVSKDKFIRMIKNGEFLEYAMYNNNYYGTSTSQLEDQNRIIVLDLERQGIEHLKSIGNQFRFIFLYCSKEELLKRLVKRQTVDIEKLHEISNRLAEADADHKVFEKGIYDIGVENNDIDDTLEIINNFLDQDESK